jgi:hypothetical protein
MLSAQMEQQQTFPNSVNDDVADIGGRISWPNDEQIKIRDNEKLA